MKTLFRSRDLWGLVEKGIDEEEDEHHLSENQKKDAKALFLIQQALDERVLVRITEAQTSKQAWDILKIEYQGSSKIIAVKLHTLRQELETVRMKNSESIQDYVSRVLAIVHQIRALGEVLTDQTVVAKIMRSLTTKFNHVVSSISEGNDLTMLTVDELGGSLQAHEAMLDLSIDKMEDKAFSFKGNTSDSFSHAGRG